MSYSQRGNKNAKGNVLSESSRRKIGKASSERVMSEYNKMRLIEVNTGNKYNVGRVLSEEHKTNPPVVRLFKTVPCPPFPPDETEYELISKIRSNLTSLEDQVFMLKINNFDYIEIANLLCKSPKSIDNALQRIKTKVKTILTKI